MELLFDNLRAAYVSVMRQIGLLFLDLCRVLIVAITLPPDHPQSTTRLRSYRQCYHQPAFLGGAFTKASAV